MTANKKPWDQENPKPEGKHSKMSQSEKKEAKKRADEAGRPYPNLVDNMAVINEKK